MTGDQSDQQPTAGWQGAGWQGGGQPPYQPPNQPYGPYPPTFGPPRHPDAMTAIVLGGASLLVLPLLGPFAWHLGAKAGREMAAQPGRWSGDDLARIGMILGMVATALCVLFVLFFLFVIVVGFGAFASVLTLSAAAFV
jgi:hypothetical protein